MKRLNRIALVATGALLSGMMNSTAAFAQTDGTLTFSGALIEDVCTMTPQQNGVNSTCRAIDGTMQTASLTVRPATQGLLPANKGTTSMQWMNDARTVGVVTAQYH